MTSGGSLQDNPLPSSAGISPAASQPTAAQPELWTLRDLLLFIVFLFVAFIITNLLMAAGFILLHPWMSKPMASQEASNSPFLLLAMTSLFYAFVLGYIYLLVAINYRRPFWSTLGWRKPTASQSLEYLVGGAILSGLVQLAPPLLPDSSTFPLERLLSSAAAAYALGSFAILIAPLMEEVIFRGLLFAIFERRVGLRFAVLTTAILFAGLHLPEYWKAWNHALTILLVGLVFSAARGITGSLTPSILLHAGYNASMVISLFYATHHFHNLPACLFR